MAQNGDASKPAIAFAQAEFALQTMKAELIDKRVLEVERIPARQELTDTEKGLSAVVFEQSGGNEKFGLMRSEGAKHNSARARNR